MKWKLYAKVQRPEKRVSSWEEGLSSLVEGEWAVAESQRGMMQDEVKIVCQGETPWKTTSSWEEGLSSLPEGEWAAAESQRGMTQETKRMTTRQTKKIEKESINIMFRAT